MGAPPVPGGFAAARALVKPRPLERKPKGAMKKLNWNKLPDRELNSNPHALWVKLQATTLKIQVNYNSLEEVFAQRQAESKQAAVEEKKPSKPVAVTLLDSKRSMSVNIAVKLFRIPNTEIIAAIDTLNPEVLTEERLQALQKLFPFENDEVATVSGYDGDFAMLAEAEKFIFMLFKVPAYGVRIEAMLFRIQFPVLLADIQPAIGMMEEAVDAVCTNVELHELLLYILELGNFINAGSFAGNACGYSIGSLLKLIDTKADNVTLLHFVADEINQPGNTVVTNLKTIRDILKKTERLQLDSVGDQLNALAKKHVALAEKLDKSNLTASFTEFLSSSRASLDACQTHIKDLKAKVAVAAQFFCEKTDSFKLEELLATFAEFSKQLVQAIDQNAARKAAARKAADRKKAMDEMKDKQAVPSDGAVVDNLVARVQKGDFTRGMSKAAAATSTTDAKGSSLSLAASTDAKGSSSTLAKIDEDSGATPASKPLKHTTTKEGFEAAMRKAALTSAEVKDQPFAFA